MNEEKLFHIYIGPVYQGCIRGVSSMHAMGRWAKQARCSQIILRAEEAKSVPAVKMPTKKESRK
jgi:hypothetical protein